jgi:hypothetical protein
MDNTRFSEYSHRNGEINPSFLSSLSPLNLGFSSSVRVLSLQHHPPPRQKNDLFADVEFYCFCCVITTNAINRSCVLYRTRYMEGFPCACTMR